MFVAILITHMLTKVSDFLAVDDDYSPESTENDRGSTLIATLYCKEWIIKQVRSTISNLCYYRDGIKFIFKHLNKCSSLVVQDTNNFAKVQYMASLKMRPTYLGA